MMNLENELGWTPDPQYLKPTYEEWLKYQVDPDEKPEDPEDPGIYGQSWLRWMQDNHNERFMYLYIKGELYKTAHEVEKMASEFFTRMNFKLVPYWRHLLNERVENFRHCEQILNLAQEEIRSQMNREIICIER